MDYLILCLRCAPLPALALLPSLAHAHASAGGVHDFAHGLAHPFGGLDHVCAMIAVGVWAAQIGGRTTWAAPVAFVSIMVAGVLLGLAEVRVPFVEVGIAMSVLVLGLLIAAAVRLSLVASVAVVGLFALFHGYAHGAEIPQGAPAFGYALGFVVATSLLHASGIAAGLAAGEMGRPQWLRHAGVVIMLCGGGIWLAA